MISVKNLNISFKDKVIFDKFNIDFNNNEIYSIIGKSGSGKSTLLRVMAGLLKPNKGYVRYNNEIVEGPTKNIFMMHQNYVNFPWKNCLDNILFPIKINRKITNEDIEVAKNILYKMGLEKCEKMYPHELSGGMKQRLALARILISKPDVILMDEPLSALDPDTRKDMQNMILDIQRSISNMIIMVTHDHNEAYKMSKNVINL